MFSLIWAWMNDWVKNLQACDLGRHRAHYDVTVMEPGRLLLSMASQHWGLFVSSPSQFGVLFSTTGWLFILSLCTRMTFSLIFVVCICQQMHFVLFFMYIASRAIKYLYLSKLLVSCTSWARVGVTKHPFVNFAVRKIFGLMKMSASLYEWHWYLTGVTAAKLRRHLSNMNAMLQRVQYAASVPEEPDIYVDIYIYI